MSIPNSKEIGEKPWHTEGKNTSEWVLLDYCNIVVHVFQEQTSIFSNSINVIFPDLCLYMNRILLTYVPSWC